MIEINRPKRRFLRARVTSAVAMLIVMAGCGRGDGPAIVARSDTTLTVGYEPNAVSIQEAIANLAVEGLLDFGRDGRPRPWLAEKWSSSDDGLTWRIWLRPNATFHDGEPVSAASVRDVLVRQLPEYLGGSFEDLQEIRVVSDFELEVLLKRRSTFLLEGLEAPIRKSGPSIIGTGPFQPATGIGAGVEMRANPNYYAGKPSIDRVVFRRYPSVRAAWADLLRGRVDMLYQVGGDALDSLRSSTETNVFTFQRAYTHLVILNVQKPVLRDRSFRRALNAAIDRPSFVAEALKGRGSPADGPVWPYHWAFDQQLPRFGYSPTSVSTPTGRPHFTCMYSDPTHERMALMLQQQLFAVGVDVSLEAVPFDQAIARVEAGDFDAWLADAGHGPTLIRPSLFWHSGAPYNWGGFKSAEVDEALDTIRRSSTDDEYKAGVAAFQRAIIDDPPAIFLAWSQRSRAVSTRFEVPADADGDIWSTLRMWRPAADARMANRN